MNSIRFTRNYGRYLAVRKWSDGVEDLTRTEVQWVRNRKRAEDLAVRVVLGTTLAVWFLLVFAFALVAIPFAVHQEQAHPTRSR